MRKIFSVMMIAIMSVFMLSMPVLAADTGSVIMPMSLQSSSCDLSISGMTATSSCSISATGCDSISVTLSLQKYKDSSWETVKSKTQSTTNGKLLFSMTKLITAGKFRAKAVVTVKQGSKTETSTMYSATKTKS